MVQSADGLLNACFPEEKRHKVMELCLLPSREISLQIMDRSHPLLDKFVSTSSSFSNWLVGV